MAKNKNVKPTRGRPVIPVNFNFGKNPFTIDAVVKRCKGKVSRAAVYNKLMGPKGLVTTKQARIVDHNGPRSEGRGHPTYRYQLVGRKPRKPVATPAVA